MPVQRLLLVELVHLTFEAWFIKQFHEGTLPKGFFCVTDLQKEYVELCWREEQLWREWCDGKG